MRTSRPWQKDTSIKVYGMLAADLRADREKSSTPSSVCICSYPHHSLLIRFLGRHVLLRRAKVGLKQPPHKAQVTWARRAQKTEDREKKEIWHISHYRQFLVTAPNEALPQKSARF